MIKPLDDKTDIDSHTPQDKRFLQGLFMVVEGHLTEKMLSVDDITKELNLSRIQLYQKTKALLNCSVDDYLLQRRMAKAQYLLLEGLYVTEIAKKIGFSSGTYFTAAFRKHFGVISTICKKDQLKRYAYVLLNSYCKFVKKYSQWRINL